MPEYRNPPLTEAACEFRFDSGEPWDPTIFGLLYDRLKNSFPLRRTVKAIETAQRQEGDGRVQEVTVSDQIQFLSTKGEALVQVRPNVLSVHHLKPYPGWASFQALAVKSFETYRDVASPKGLTRIGLRYINRFEFPAPEIDPSDYFELYPHIGPTLPQRYYGGIAGIHIPYQEDHGVLRITMRDLAEGLPLRVALDMDYFLDEPGAVKLEEVQGWLLKAHARISAVFEGSIKERTRKLLEAR